MAFDIFEDDLQRAALEPHSWPELLHNIGRQAGAIGAILITEAHRIPVPPVSRDLESLMARYYGEGWNAADIRFRGVDIALRTGAVTDQQIFTSEEVERSPYYQDLLRPEGCGWFCGVHFDVAGSPWFLTLQRAIGQGPFTPDEVARLTTLRRPLHTAATLSHALSFAQVSGMADAFEHLGKPALILDERGLLIRCNAGGERILGALASSRNGEIRFHEATNQRSFETALVEAGFEAQWSGRTRRPAVLRDAAGRAWTLETTALGDWGRYSFTQARYLILFDEILIEATGTGSWRARYGLTPAEIRVAESLAAGLSVRAIADRHGVTYETARTQLKAVLSKTGASRQSELVSMLLREQARGE